MEVAALAGLLGLGYAVSKSSQKRSQVQGDYQAYEPFANQALSKEPRGSEPFANQALSKEPRGSELDMMYQNADGQTRPADSDRFPRGNAFDYGQRVPVPRPTAPSQQPIDSNVPMVEYRSDGVEATPTYPQRANGQRVNGQRVNGQHVNGQGATDQDADFMISPLSGERIRVANFTHNNMQPFYGGRIKQNMAPQANTSRLDMYNGSGSTQVRKTEVENMFQVRTPFGNPNGMEEHTEFFQSRVATDAPMARNGERPFEPTRIGAGLGERGGVTGKGGFQQLEVNEIMRPKDTNDLRVLSNPKETFDQPMISGAHFVGSAAQSAGEVRKYAPDRFYVDPSGERFFVTTGDVIKETVRSTQVMPHTTRPETSTEYSGIAASQDFSEGYVTGSYRTPMTQQYGGSGYRNADASSYYTRDTDADRADYGKSSIEIRPNERNETSERVMALNAVPADNGLVTTHFTDDARPTRRGETVGNIRGAGTPYHVADRGAAITVWDPKDIARTTVKESTIYLDRMGIAAASSAPERLKVYDPDDIAKPTQKAQLSAQSSWMGPSGNGAWSDAMDTTFATNMRSNPNKEVIAKGRKPIAGSGSVATVNGNPGRQVSRKLDADVVNGRPMAVNRSLDITPGVGDMGRMEYRVPLELDVSRQRNTFSTVESVVNNPLMQSLQKNAEIDAAAVQEYRQFLSAH